MLKPSKEFLVTVSILVVAILASQLFFSPRSPFSQWAKVGGGEATLFSDCSSDGVSLIQNSGFENLVPGFTLPVAVSDGEVCHWYGGVFPGYSASFGNPGAFARMNYVRHGYHPDWENFLNVWNSSSSDGIMQVLESPLPAGDYTLSFDRKLITGISGSMIMGLSSDPLSGDVGTVAGCDYFDTGSLMTTTAQNAHASDMEHCLIDQFDTLIFSSSVNDITSTQWETVTFPFTITPDEAANDLKYLYLFPWGNDPEYYVPVGEGDKPYFELGIDNVQISSETQTACAASSLTLSDTAPSPTFKNQSGNLVAISAGSSLPLSGVDSPLVTPSAFGSQYNYDSPAVLVQRIGNNKIAITPANPETEYTINDIQSMFNFENVTITDFQAISESNLGDVFGSLSKRNVFSRLFTTAHANIELTTFVVTFDCEDGASGEYTGPLFDSGKSELNISVQKTLHDNTLSILDRNITYKVRVTNEGPGTATNILVSDLLPFGLTYMSHTTQLANETYNPTTGAYSIPFLSQNQSRDLFITAKVPISACGTKINTATLVSLDGFDSNENDNAGSVTFSLPNCTTKVPGKIINAVK